MLKPLTRNICKVRIEPGYIYIVLTLCDESRDLKHTHMQQKPSSSVYFISLEKEKYYSCSVYNCQENQIQIDQNIFFSGSPPPPAFISFKSSSLPKSDIFPVVWAMGGG